jgi:ParB-like chromosome segregation protein Spo0J
MSMNAVIAAFQAQLVVLPLDLIVPQKEVSQNSRNDDFYRHLTASIKHVGLIEPLVIFQEGPATTFFSTAMCALRF